MLYIGIDLGTSAVKLLLMNEKGGILNAVSREYPLSLKQPLWSEQNPSDWYTQTILGLKELLSGQDTSSVTGISFGGQMHGLVLLDNEDQILRPAILWNDGRTTKETDFLNQEVGTARLTANTANIAFAGFTAPKLLWVKKEEPEIFAKIAKIMLPKDYLAYRLSGSFYTDVSDASGTLFFDVKNRCWSEDMLTICSITKEQLPAVYESYETVGTLKPALAKELGLSAAVKIAAGAGDNAAAAIGTGTVGNGKCNISLGTSGTIFIASSQFLFDPNHALHSFAHAGGGYHLMGCMLSAVSCNKWWMEEILNTRDYAAEQKTITASGENSVFYLPYLMGERSPHNDPFASSAFIGMTMSTKREDMTLAILEGVAFALRDSLDIARSLGISVSRATICGGGAKSALLKTLIANILNITVDTVEIEEGPAFGAAILASVSCGEYGSVQEASETLCRISETIVPDPVLSSKYEKRYSKFKKLYPALKDWYRL